MYGPVVGDDPEYELEAGDVPWILGTHLSEQVGPLARAPAGSRVLMIEAHEFARRLPYHHQKLTMVFAAMRAFRDRLQEEGYDVTYVQAETFGEALDEFFTRNPDTTLVAMRSPSYGSGRRFDELVTDAGGALRLVENELFCSTREAFDEWATGEQFRHEQFYRWMRRESGVLMTDDGPVGGEWNYDDENREFPPADWDAPPIPDVDPRPETEAVSEWVSEAFDTWGQEVLDRGKDSSLDRGKDSSLDRGKDSSLDRGKDSSQAFHWPVTREQALAHLDHFLEHRLATFGPYQDAMRGDDWAMSHSLLSSAINLGLLHPFEVVEAVEAAFEERADVPLSSAEGCIRQLLGWREFMRHCYRHAMPELATANQLDSEYDLPDCYWSGETEMACIGQTVDAVHARGYVHHIQRLMVLANFATLWGVEPRQLNEWFHATFVDAYHWVTTPNVVEMGQYAHGVFATKPYVSSANYVDRMSDYCGDCHYHKTKTTGERACPFNALYWNFLDRNEGKLRSNHRMGLMYSHVDDKRESDELDEVRDRVAQLREQASEGEL